MRKWLDRASLLIRRETLGGVLERLARVHGERPLAEEAGPSPLSLTYAEAAQRVDRMAGAIAARIATGDRVVVATPNGYDMFLLCLAACRAGGVAVPVNPQMAASEISHVIADSEAAMVVRDPAELVGGPALGGSHPADPADVAAIFYTSGTTGAPKGVRLSHRAVLGQVLGGAVWPAGLRRDEAVLGLPVAHIMGFVVLLGLAVAGIPVYFLPRFRPDTALDAIEGRRASVFVGVPAMYRMLLEAGAEQRDLTSVRVWASGADVMPPDLARRFQQLGASATLPVVDVSIGDAVFLEGYGMVEAAGGVAAKVSPPLVPLPIGNLVGVPLPPYRLRVVGEDGRPVALGQTGELQVRGPGLLEGYHGDREATAAILTSDGWLRTGDLARRGPLGLVFFAGRSKDVIKHGGFSVYALEVQKVLERHPAVAEAAVVGVPDRRRGEVVAAAVRLLPGAAASEEELRAWAASHLSDYKVPERLRIVHELPRTGTEKVRKADLLPLFQD